MISFNYLKHYVGTFISMNDTCLFSTTKLSLLSLLNPEILLPGQASSSRHLYQSLVSFMTILKITEITSMNSHSI